LPLEETTGIGQPLAKKKSVSSTASLPALAGYVADALGLCLASSSSITTKVSTAVLREDG
jgi:hypothetical protein